ncbi:MAG: hypothetical protein JWR35_2601 [Marmoricola sp.]|jgi:two-component system OmpR family sensor kinase|nr:hypothetical protein [Marmoricola sp.]
MRLPGRTLRARIVWSTALVSAVAMAAMVGAVVVVLGVLTNHNISTALNNQLAAVTATVQFSATGGVSQLATPDDAIDDTTWVFDSHGAQIVGPRVGEHEQTTAVSLASTRARVEIDRRDRAYLAAPITIEKTGKVGAVVVVSASRQPYETSRDIVAAGLVLVGLLVAAGSAAIAAWTIRRALEPVESMAKLAEDWSEHDLESRFVGVGHDEISQLGNTLNVLLDRVANAIRSEQQLTSELAHELRTPLTAIRGEAELGMMISPDERLTRIVDLTDRMTSTINTLLAVARGHDSTGTRCFTSEVIAMALADLPATALRIQTVGPDLLVSAPVELAVRALAPLVVNAVQHAASEVTVTASANGRGVEISVSDDGAGLAAADPDELFTAGVRDEQSTGVGLGLALSRRVARTLGGDVLVTSPSSPTTFTLTMLRF